jgi:hypothetical protein
LAHLRGETRAFKKNRFHPDLAIHDWKILLLSVIKS